MSLSSQPSETNSKRIDRLFLIFSAFYGQLWRSQFKNEDFLVFMKNEWHLGLLQFADDHIEEAVKKCRNIKEFPPTLPHFIDLCKSAKNVYEFHNLKKEPCDKANPEVAFHHLAKIKAMLQMKSK